MPVSVNPPKTPVTEGSNGIAAATIPNVCKMPGPPAPFVPVPLPNIGKSGDSPKGYTTKVTIEGKNVAIQGATFNSMGDVASKGTGGGLVSANTHGITKFVGPGSMDVKFEGKNVQLLSDPMLNNCAGGGSPPNAATMLGVIQGPLMMLVVVEGSEMCPVCEESTHALKESEATKADAAGLERALEAASFAPRDISMLGVAHCRCGTPKKSAARSTMQRSGDFTKAASGYLTPAYADYSSSEGVLEKIKARTENKDAFDKAVSVADRRRREFVEQQKKAPGKSPQVNVPGSCAAPRAVLLLLEDGGLAGAITERWCGSATMANPVAHFDDTSGERKLVEDRVFGHGDTVPPCLACDALLPLLVCDKDKLCHS